MTAISLMFAYSCKNKKADDMTFSFTNVEITENSLDATVTPSDLERNYFFGILPSADVKGKDDVQIISEAPEMKQFTKQKGVLNCDNHELQAETDYLAMAFACEDAEKVTRYAFRTLAATQDSVPETPEEPIEPEEPIVPEEPETVVLNLSADKTSILADGEDATTFTVELNGELLADSYLILNVEDSTALNNNTFSTLEAGAYKFVALYNRVYSNEVVIEAQVVEIPDPVVELVADKKEIKNDGSDKVTFTVLVDGEDMTAEAEIFNETDNSNLNGNSFSSENAGTYVFSATYNGFKSENLTIVVIEALAYKPGDLYDVNGVKGVVFFVEEGGKSGLIMSMDETYLPWSTEYVWVNCLTKRGDWHTEDMLKLGADKYPAAKWCADHGDGWYMPSSYEMNLMWDAVSDGKRVFDHDFVKLYNDKLDDPILEDYYWSSNETSEELAEVVVFIDDSVICLDPLKTNSYNVRAIRKF